MNTAQHSQPESEVDASAQVPRKALRRRKERLAAALINAETRLASVQASGDDAYRIELCRGLLAQAREAMDSGAIWGAAAREFFAWDCLAQFDRQMVHLVGEAELQNQWLSLKAEAAEKLSGHRLQAFSDIAAHANQHCVRPFTVEAALEHLQTTSQNQYYMLGQLRRQIAYTGVFLFTLIMGVLTAAGFGFFESFLSGLDQKLQLGTLLGLIGGVISVASTISKTDEKAKIPRVRASFETTLVRPLMGAALALPVVLLVDSGLINIGGSTNKTWLVAIACFLAGFSERWFLGLVEVVEKRSAQTPEKKA